MQTKYGFGCEPNGSAKKIPSASLEVYDMMKDDYGNIYAYCYLLGTLGWKYILYGLRVIALQ